MTSPLKDNFKHALKLFMLDYYRAQIFNEGNIDRLTSFRSLMGKILTDGLLDNLYLLYNSKILKGKILTDY